MKRLLLVDGSNIIMRAAFGGQLEPSKARVTASGLIRRAVRQAGASHLIIAVDSSAPSWRKQEYPDYKADRTTDTEPWIRAAKEHWQREGWRVEENPGFEADDIIATLAARAIRTCAVTVVSSDSDLLTLVAQCVDVLKPMNGGMFHQMTAAAVCDKYDIPSVELLTDLKALAGEASDNVPGVPGIGPVKAAKLLNTYGALEAILKAGSEERCKESVRVREHYQRVKDAYRLVSLRTDVPIAPMLPSACELRIDKTGERCFAQEEVGGGR